MISRKILAVGILGLLFAGCATSGLERLVLEGPELHPSLETSPLGDSIPLRPRGLVQRNPHLSAEGDFVEAVARGGTQGRLGGRGIGSALYAFYLGERGLGLYGLEANSKAEADRWEDALRGIWAQNASLNRARVHREGRVLVVVWTNDDSPEIWQSANQIVADRLAETGR